MGSSCPLLSSPTGNDPAFPKLTLIAHSHTGGRGASFGSAIKESLLPEKAIHLSRNTVPPGSNYYRLQHGKGWFGGPSIYNGHFFSKTWYCGEKVFENLSTLLSESAPGFVPMLCPFTLQRTEICRLLSMPVRKIFLRELVSTQVIFKTLRGDRACKTLSAGEVAAAVRLRWAGFGEGTPQQDSDGTECAKCEIWHLGRILLSVALNLPSLYNGHFFSKKQGVYL